MRTSAFCYTVIILLCMPCSKALAYDIAIDNDEGVTIYYNYINDNTELEVTHNGINSYSDAVNIPESVTILNRTRVVSNIGERAFSSCISLKSVFIPNSVTNIGNYAFYDCDALTSITIPTSVVNIGDGAFSGDNSLTEVIIPEGIITIGNDAFSRCGALPTITLPNSIENIGYSAFAYCSSLASVIIPSNITVIESSTFAYCISLNSATIPSNVTSIGADAFYECRRLAAITIPENVTSIGKYAFYGCNSLASVVSLIQEPLDIDISVFPQITYDNGTLYVPQGTIERYKVAEGWKEFSFIEEDEPAGIKISTLKNTNIKEIQHYTFDGKRFCQPQQGLNIIRMDNGAIKKVIIN